MNFRTTTGGSKITKNLNDENKYEIEEEKLILLRKNFNKNN